MRSKFLSALGYVLLVAFITIITFVGAMGVAHAQERVPHNTGFTIGATHDGVLAQEYRLYQNNVVVQTVARSTVQNNTIRFQFAAGLPRGTYSFQMTTVSPDGVESVRSEPALVVQFFDPTVPVPPAGLFITIGVTPQADGSLRLTIERVEHKQ